MKKLFGLLLVFSMLVFTSCERINVGNVGLKVNLTGSDRGVSNIKTVTGWQFYMPGVSQVVEYSTRFKSVEYPDFLVTCRGGTTFTAHPKLTYQINPLLADKCFMAFGTDNMASIEEGYLHNAMSKALGDVANKFTPDSLLYSRELYEHLVQNDMITQCGKLGIDITMFRANLSPSDAIAAAIDAKQKAVQDAQRIENEKASVIAEGEKTVAKAKLEAEAILTTAKAESEANKMKQQTLTPLLVEMAKIEAWKAGGSLVPQYVSGSGSNGFLINLK